MISFTYHRGNPPLNRPYGLSGAKPWPGELESAGTKAIYYQVDLDLIDLENNAKSWYGQKKIKKVIERKRLLF